jgi:AbrB family looped-hinge helix DNA binding protein
MSITAKITSKGQITIPRAARVALKTDTVEVEIQDDAVILRPVKSVGGALSAYAKGKEEFINVRETVWQEVVNEKAADTP